MKRRQKNTGPNGKRMVRLRAGPARAEKTLRAARHAAADSDKRRRASQLDLKHQHRILSAFFENSVAPLVLLDRNFNFIQVNEAYARCCHRPVSDFTGHNHFHFHPAEFRPEFAKVVRTKRPYRAIAARFFRPAHPDEGTTYWNLHCVPILDERRRIECLVVAFEDVTEHKQAEMRLKAANALLALFAAKTTRKSYLDAVVGMLAEMSGCGRVGVRLVNPLWQIPYEASAGFDEDFLRTECWLSLKTDQCACTRVALGQPDPQDIPMMTPQGSFCCNNTGEFVRRLTEAEKTRFRGVCIQNGFATVAIVPIRYQGEILGTVHFADDAPHKMRRETVEFIEHVTPLIGEAIYRFDVEDALLGSEDRYRRIVETATEGIWVLDKEARTTFVNQRMAEMLGYTVQQLLGRPLGDFTEAELQAAADSDLGRRQGLAEQHDFRFLRKDGQELWALVSATPIYNDAGQYDGVLAMVTDITERRRLEHEILSASDETSRRIGQDLHDSLGQILVALTFQSRGLERKLAAQSAEDAAEAAHIADSAKEAATLARTLAHGLCPVQITPGGLMAAMRELAHRTAETFGIACTFTARVSLVMHDTMAAGHVYQIVQEAVTNAVTHGQAGRVTISVRPSEGRIALRVRDNGVGLPKTPFDGKGLGLRTMRHRADILGASLDIAPAPSGGTVVTCGLPDRGSQAAGKRRGRPSRRAAKRS